MNLLYLLLLILWSTFNSEPHPTTAQHPWTVKSDEWRITAYPSTPGAKPCGYWYNKPCYWATTQPSDTSTPDQTQMKSDEWRITGYPSTPGAKPCGYWYNKPCYWATTQPSYTSTPDQTQTQNPYKRRLYSQTPSNSADAPVPNITVYVQMPDREHVIVMCSFGRRFTRSSFQLSVAGEHNYTLKNPLCYSNEKCVFEVKVSPPVSFTCVHEINSVVNRHSETYTYSPSAQNIPIMSTLYYNTQNFPAVLDHHEEGVSSFYIGFFSFIVVGLVIMTAAVIMATFKSNAKAFGFRKAQKNKKTHLKRGSKITEAANDYTNV